jgi:hypothetical protein
MKAMFPRVLIGNLGEEKNLSSKVFLFPQPVGSPNRENRPINGQDTFTQEHEEEENDPRSDL